MDIHMPLLADFFDVLQRLFPVIVILLTGLAQFMAGRNEKKQAKPKRRPAPARPVAPGEKPPGAPNDPLRDEIEDFLRRAQGRPPAQEAKAEAPKRRPAEQPAPPQRPAQRQPIQPPRRPAPPEPRLEKKPKPPKPRRSKPVAPAESVSSLAAAAPHLAEEVALADDKLESHLKETFEHNVGSLAHVESASKSKATPSPMATELLDLLSRPGGMAQLVIANEILNRPTDRFRSRRRDD